MRPTKLMNRLEEHELKKRTKASKDREQFQRWQSIFLTSKGLQAGVVAEYLGTTRGTVHQWVYQYNHDGPDGFLLHGRGGIASVYPLRFIFVEILGSLVGPFSLVRSWWRVKRHGRSTRYVPPKHRMSDRTDGGLWNSEAGNLLRISESNLKTGGDSHAVQAQG